jgi:hypothetical protein
MEELEDEISSGEFGKVKKVWWMRGRGIRSEEVNEVRRL